LPRRFGTTEERRRKTGATAWRAHRRISMA
jgi:hypothetical protein